MDFRVRATKFLMPTLTEDFTRIVNNHRADRRIRFDLTQATFSQFQRTTHRSFGDRARNRHWSLSRQPELAFAGRNRFRRFGIPDSAC